MRTLSPRSHHLRWSPGDTSVMDTPRTSIRRNLAVTLAAVSALAIVASPAAARPAIDSIDIERLSASTTRIEVEADRSSVTNRTRMRAWVAGRSFQLRNTGPDVDGDIVFARTVRWSTREYDRYRVRVRACDGGACTTMTRRVVVDDDRFDSDQGDRQPAWNGGGATSAQAPISAERAARIAQDRFGGFVEDVWREDDFGAAWEVELEDARFEGARRDLDVYVNAAGRIVNVVIDDEGRGYDDRAPRLVQASFAVESGLGPDEAARIAQERFGGFVEDVWREDDYGAAWEVELERTNDAGRDLDVYVDGQGQIVEVKTDGPGRDRGDRGPNRDDEEWWSNGDGAAIDDWDGADRAPVTVGPDEAARIAQERFGGEAERVERGYERGASWVVALTGDWDLGDAGKDRSWWGDVKAGIGGLFDRLPFVDSDELAVYVGADGQVLYAERD